METNTTNEPTQPANPSVPEWFGTSSDPSTQLTPRKPRKPHLKMWFIFGVIALVAIACVSIALFIIQSNRTTTCLDGADYTTLTGQEAASDLSPTDSFYSDYIAFQDTSTNLDNDSDYGQHGDKLIEKIAKFYKEHSSKSIIITIGANYFTTDSEDLANQRINKVGAKLIDAGVPAEGVISSGDANYIEPEDSSAIDNNSSETTITITSEGACESKSL